MFTRISKAYQKHKKQADRVLVIVAVGLAIVAYLWLKWSSGAINRAYGVDFFASIAFLATAFFFSLRAAINGNYMQATVIVIVAILVSTAFGWLWFRFAEFRDYRPFLARASAYKLHLQQ
jgi:UDP-N-acetylmuramyl pentapeptide phosphotransferase/UDP-N-acetylglucosamine-1-phosphate transferase